MLFVRSASGQPPSFEGQSVDCRLGFGRMDFSLARAGF